MKNYGKSKAEISKAFNSIANKSTYGSVTLKAKVVYLMQHPELVEIIKNQKPKKEIHKIRNISSIGW